VHPVLVVTLPSFDGINALVDLSARAPNYNRMLLKTNHCLLWSVCLVLILVCACSPSHHDQLIVGMELNYPPFEMVDTNGKPAGIGVELAQALASHLGRELQIENIPFDGLIPALKTSKIDLVISSMTETAERAQSIDFSQPYLSTGLCLLVSKASTIKSIADADQSQFSIAVKQGTTGQTYAQQRLQHAKLLVLDKEDACVLEVVQGKASAFIYDQMSIYKHWQQHKESTTALLQPFQQEQWAIGLRKGQKELTAKVNSFLTSFRAEGGFEKLGDKYLKEEKASFKQLGIPFFF
jgi:polar amino acid transport system substrate-binding protein